MYSNTYQREYARAIGDTSYDLSYHFKLLSENSRKKFNCQRTFEFTCSRKYFEKTSSIENLKARCKKNQ